MRLFAVLLVALLVAACDDSKKQYTAALKKYEALISAAKPLSDPGYHAVLEELDAIKSGDSAADAKKLADAIRRLRTPSQLPARPLARANTEGDDAVSRKAAECAELAKAVGLATDAGRDDAKAKLIECKVQLEKLDVARLHAQDPLGHQQAGHDDGEHGRDGGA